MRFSFRDPDFQPLALGGEWDKNDEPLRGARETVPAKDYLFNRDVKNGADIGTNGRSCHPR